MKITIKLLDFNLKRSRYKISASFSDFQIFVKNLPYTIELAMYFVRHWIMFVNYVRLINPLMMESI